MLVGELGGQDQGPAAAVHDPATRRLFLQITNVAPAGVQQGLYDLALDPNFATNHYYYVFYTAATPDGGYDRLSRFTANADLTGTVAGQRVRPLPGSRSIRPTTSTTAAASRSATTARSTSRPASISRGRRAQDLNSPRGKVHRINMDGTRADRQPVLRRRRAALGFGLGLRPAQSVPRLLRRPDRPALHRRRRRQRQRTSNEEVDVGARGANYGWPDSEGPCSAPCTSPLYDYEHNGTGTRRSRAGSSTTARSSRPACRATTSSPTTPRTGSSA